MAVINYESNIMYVFGRNITIDTKSVIEANKWDNWNGHMIWTHTSVTYPRIKRNAQLDNYPSHMSHPDRPVTSLRPTGQLIYCSHYEQSGYP
jgi:hypothetical protein